MPSNSESDKDDMTRKLTRPGFLTTWVSLKLEVEIFLEDLGRRESEGRRRWDEEVEREGVVIDIAIDVAALHMLLHVAAIVVPLFMFCSFSTSDKYNLFVYIEFDICFVKWVVDWSAIWARMQQTNFRKAQYIGPEQKDIRPNH